MFIIKFLPSQSHSILCSFVKNNDMQDMKRVTLVLRALKSAQKTKRMQRNTKQKLNLKYKVMCNIVNTYELFYSSRQCFT